MPYMKVARTFRLPAAVIEATRVPNRSQTFERAIKHTLDDPRSLTPAFERRFFGHPYDEGTSRVTVTLEYEVADGLRSLSDRSGLPQEVLLRLALEAHMFNQ